VLVAVLGGQLAGLVSLAEHEQEDIRLSRPVTSAEN